MVNEPENITISEDGSIASVQRGDKGAVILNVTGKEQKISLGTSLPDGTYTDEVYATQFKVKNGKISGKVEPLKSYILINK